MHARDGLSRLLRRDWRWAR